MTLSDPPNSARDLIPPEPTVPQLRQAAAMCTARPLYRNATQTVFGEGPEEAPLMLVGEQPGDVEDTLGRPFVGPAGRLLDRCLDAAGLDRGRLYLTNVVKHFKWVPRGRRRTHETPAAAEIAACLPWLEAEIAAAAPRVLIALGASAAQALFGRDFRVTRERGRVMRSTLAPYALASVHPAALLRIPDAIKRDEEIRRFVAELRAAAALLE
ncbi:MAG: UdgX family uracil-DNA binding protein [Stellaceae bacterium]